MYPNGGFQKQSGAGLPIAIFIITVLALLVFGMAQVQQSSGEAVSLQIQSQRAFYAAESGAQIGVQRVLSQLDSGISASCPADIGNFGSAAGLNSCSIEYSCESPSSDVFTLVSIGTCGAGQDAAQRTVEVRVR